MAEVTIHAAREELLESYRLCIDAVAKERIHIARLEGPSPDEMRTMFESAEQAGVIQKWAIDGDRVVGWASVFPKKLFGLEHSAGLAVAVHADYRRQGIGERLMRDAIETAWDAGLERIELEVWSHNKPAISLYEKLGFRHEGVQRNYRYLDGRYTAAVMMALLKDPR